MNEMYNVIGIEYRSYVSKKTGKNVEGYNIYLTYTGPKNTSMQGMRCVSEWISVDAFDRSKVKVGDQIYVLYNRYGRVEDIGKAG